jgi:hypothetical protein
MRIDIEQEVLHLYGNLMGKADTHLMGIDIVAMRAGPQVTSEQRDLLLAPIHEGEILLALKSNRGLKSSWFGWLWCLLLQSYLEYY